MAEHICLSQKTIRYDTVPISIAVECIVFFTFVKLLEQDSSDQPFNTEVLTDHKDWYIARPYLSTGSGFRIERRPL